MCPSVSVHVAYCTILQCSLLVIPILAVPCCKAVLVFSQVQANLTLRSTAICDNLQLLLYCCIAHLAVFLYFWELRNMDSLIIPRAFCWRIEDWRLSIFLYAGKLPHELFPELCDGVFFGRFRSSCSGCSARWSCNLYSCLQQLYQSCGKTKFSTISYIFVALSSFQEFGLSDQPHSYSIHVVILDGLWL